MSAAMSPSGFAQEGVGRNSAAYCAARTNERGGIRYAIPPYGLYRIHGTNQPERIGQAVSSGCIRMTNEDVIDLYDRARQGATVVVLPPSPNTWTGHDAGHRS